MVRVKVFNFKAYDPISDRYVVPICKRQLHDIEAPPISGLVMTDTVQLVDPNDLDKDGRYDPRAFPKELIVSPFWTAPVRAPIF